MNDSGHLADVVDVVLAAVVVALELDAEAGQHGPHAEGLVLVEVEVDVLEVDPLVEVARHVELGDGALARDLRLDVPVPARHEQERVGRLPLLSRLLAVLC